MIVIERTDTGYHHYFVNRTTTKTDGTYDLSVAPGTYRLQVLYPTNYSQTDEQRDPPTNLGAMLRLIGASFPVASSVVAMPSGDVSFTGYASFSPSGSSTLPTTFSFKGVGSTPSRLEVYGTANDGGAPNIGDPWFTSPTVTTGTAMFDGGFNTNQATETSAALGERYFWGVEQTLGSPDAGPTWTAQTMVFDITWH
jgi:hypothetical protein